MKRIYHLIILILMGLTSFGQNSKQVIKEQNILFCKGVQCNISKTNEFKCNKISTYCLYDTNGQIVTVISPRFVNSLSDSIDETLYGYSMSSYAYDSSGNEVSAINLFHETFSPVVDIHTMDLHKLKWDSSNWTKNIYVENKLMEEQWGNFAQNSSRHFYSLSEPRYSLSRKYYYTSDSTYFSIKISKSENEPIIYRTDYLKTLEIEEEISYQFKVVVNEQNNTVKNDTVLMTKPNKRLTLTTTQISDSVQAELRKYQPSIDLPNFRITNSISPTQSKYQRIILHDKGAKKRYLIILNQGKFVSSYEYIYKSGLIVKEISLYLHQNNINTSITKYDYGTY